MSIGLTRVLVTCDDDNVGSIKTIEKNRGVLEGIVAGRDGDKPKRRYWIATADESRRTWRRAGSCVRNSVEPPIRWAHTVYALHDHFVFIPETRRQRSLFLRDRDDRDPADDQPSSLRQCRQMTGPDHAVAEPAPPLRPFVSHYAGSRMRDVPQWEHAGLPSRYIDLIVSLARPIEIARMPGAQRAGAYCAFVAGLQQAPALVRMGGDLDCLHIFLKPGAARALLGVSGRDVASQVVHLADIDGAMCAELMERLGAAHTWLERFAAVDRVLLGRLRPVTMPDAIAWAWRRLAISDGRMAVHELARDIGFSRRHFGERFKSELGIAPKAAARVFRFERACRLFLRSPRRIADVAMASGFHDQAHMVREWHALAGCTPREWILGQLPFLQDYEIGGGHD